MELPILAVGVAVVVTQMVQNQAVQVSSSLNTPHPYNPHLSTVVLAHGSHLLAYLLLTTLWLRVVEVVEMGCLIFGMVAALVLEGSELEQVFQ
jgi:hypothetical protein